MNALKWKCLQSNVLYQATVTSTGTYVGLATNFKKRLRFRNHMNLDTLEDGTKLRYDQSTYMDIERLEYELYVKVENTKKNVSHIILIAKNVIYAWMKSL